MPSAASSTEPHLSRWELVGAWLHVWTPPKGLEVPPIPWRKVALWSVGLAIVLAIAAAIAVPRINQAKKEGAAERARQALAADNAERARLRADQNVHRVAIPAGAQAVTVLQNAISADARARVRAKTITGPVQSTSCTPAGSSATQFPASRVYKCFVETASSIQGEGKDVLGSGYPFVATIYTEQHSAAWCKENPHADEKGSRGDVRVKLSPVCAGNLTNVL
jgi:type II secretory pathway pseudopilin PulG